MNFWKKSCAAAMAVLLSAAMTPFSLSAAAAQDKTPRQNIVLSAFWPPTAEYLEGGEGDERWDEQYGLLRDAEIDLLCNVTGRDRVVNRGEDFVPCENTKEINLKMAQYAAKYGMKVIVADERFGDALNSASPEEIAAAVSDYRDVPGVGGYFLKDEPAPGHALDYIYAYEQLKLADPDKEVHFNFLPLWSYGTPPGTLTGAEEGYRQDVSFWLEGCADCGFPADYLMYDFYPYQGHGSNMNREVFFSNLDAVRKLGLEYGTDTAKYLQSVGGANRSPNPSELRYEMMISLAYGYKQLSYFTWFLPTNRGSESFEGSIVDDNGVPNEKTYSAVCALNREAHALGKTLVRLDAREVYFNGFSDPRQVWGDQQMLPENFFVVPAGKERFALSLMKDRETGRNYVMFVNNSYEEAMTFTVRFEGVESLSRVSKTDGAEEETPLENGSLTLSLAAGDGELFALPAGLDFVKEPETEQPPAEEPPAEEPPAEDPPAEEPPAKEPEEQKTGCGAILSAAPLAIAAAAAFVLLRKKN